MRARMKRFAIVILLIISGVFAADRCSAQYYSWGVDPVSLRWRQMKSDTYRVVYPSVTQDIANRMMLYLDAVQDDIAYGYKYEQMSIPFVVHPANMLSNGLVMWLPKRVEYLSTPAVDGYSMPWTKQLIAHEYRHAAQYNNLNRGLIKGLSYLLGQQSSTVGLLFMPLWMMEGDAVQTETEMSTYGRGLQPSFTMAYRAIGDVYGEYKNFDKWICGSYKDNIPNHYALGYLVCRHSYNRFGTIIGNDVAELMKRRPYMVISNTWTFRRLYGVSQPELFEDAFDTLYRHWQSQPQVVQSTEPIEIPEVECYTEYSHPIATEGGSIITLKSDLDKAMAFVEIDPATGEERRIAHIGMLSSRPALSTTGRLWWTEYRRSAWFEQEVTSRLCYMDLDDERKRTVAKQRNVLYPTPTSGHGIAWVEYAWNGRYAIVINGKSTIGNRVELPIGKEVHGMAWDDATEALYVIITDDDGMHIARVESEGLTQITKPAYTTLSALRAKNGRLYFGSIASGRDELHYYDLATCKEYRISTSSYGSFSPMPMDSTTVVATSYDRRGYLPVTQDMGDATEVIYAPHPPLTVLPESKPWGVVNLDTVRFDSATATEITSKTPPKRFSRALHAFNIHSWAPASYDPYDIMEQSRISFNLGATIMSQNILSTMEGFLTWGWNPKEGSVFRGKLRYNGLGVNLWAQGTYGGKQQIYRVAAYNPEKGKVEYSPTPERGKYFSVGAGATLPILIDKGYHTQQLTLSASWNYSNGKVANIDELRFEGGKISNVLTVGYTEGVHQLSMSASFQDFVRMSHRDFLPPWGVVFMGGYTLNPTTDDMGHLAVIYGKLYTPGFAKHHSLSLAASYQTSLGGFHSNDVLSELTFKSTMLLPRGFSTYDIVNDHYIASSLNYHLPVWYPDGGWSGVIYFKRLRLNVGVDYASFRKSNSFNQHGEIVKRRKHIGAMGVDLGVDFNIFSMPSAATISATFSLYRKASPDPATNGKLHFGFGLGLPF